MDEAATGNPRLNNTKADLVCYSDKCGVGANGRNKEFFLATVCVTKAQRGGRGSGRLYTG